MIEYYFEDFTEENYKSLLDLAKKNYCFTNYSEYKKDGKNIIWRHDIDLSVHRAYTLAHIEMEYDVSATYFINLHSSYYNVFEIEITSIIKRILEMGHKLGLHFDPSFYGETYGSYTEEDLLIEKQILEKVFNTGINAVSFHNPTSMNFKKMNDEVISDMINTYSDYFMNKCNYCSDSNGYWRFERLEDVLREAKYERLQVLTHPEWWTPEPMSPRERISRCIEGRALRNQLKYDQLLDKFGRKNIK